MAHASILYITLGCAKNEVDTDRMRSLLNGAGYEEVFDAGDADAVIVNTCSFLASATSESIETTLALAEDVAEGVLSLIHICPSSRAIWIRSCRGPTRFGWMKRMAAPTMCA